MTIAPTVIHCDPEILGGTPVFAGTRVPVQALWDYLEEGSSLGEFLQDFPSVSREQAAGALEAANAALEEYAHIPGPKRRAYSPSH